MATKNQLSIKDYSFRIKLWILFGVIFIMSVLNFSVIFYYKSLEKTDALIINTAGKQRTLSQQIALFSTQIVNGNTTAVNNLRAVVDECSSSLLKLKNGGTIVTDEEEIVIPPISREQESLITELEKEWNEYKKNAEIILQSEGTGDKDLALSYVNRNSRNMLDLFNELVQSFVKKNDEKQHGLTLILIGLLLLNLLILVGAYFLGKRFLIRPTNEIKMAAENMSEGKLSIIADYRSNDELGSALTSLSILRKGLSDASDFAMAIGNGNYEMDYAALSEKDKLGSSLLDMRSQLQEIAQKDGERNWIIEGLAKFADLLRGDNKNIKDFSDRLLSETVKYINANQGSLFLVKKNKNDPDYLELISSYAWNRNKFLTKRIEIGQGLAGQAWQEGNIIYLEDIPNDYVNITSGLGEALPRCIIIIPLKTEESVEGVLELALFEKLLPFQREFLGQLAENMATTYASLVVNKQTKDLLEKSQEQAEMLRSQEEEMRQNMEELQATQEEMARQTKEMNQFNEAVNRSSIIVEFDSNGRFHTVNDQFLEITGYERDDIIGRPHEFYVPEKLLQSGEFHKLWEDLSKGKRFVKDIQRLRKDGSIFWLRASYMPIIDSNGTLERISCICFEVTREKEREIEIENFTQAIDSSSIIIDFNKQGKIIHINKKFKEVTGYTEEEMIGQPHTYYVPKSGIKSGAFEKLWADLSKGEYFVRDVERVKKDGSPLWLRASYMPMFDEDGKLEKISCVCFDITEEQKREKEINDFTQAVDSSSIIIDFNKEGKIVHINKRFKEVTGYTEEEMIGQPHTYYVPKSGIKSGAFEKLWADLSKGQHFVRDVERVKKDGSPLWLRASYMPMFDVDGNLEKISCVCFDITEEHKREQEIADFTNAVDNSSIIIDFNKEGKIVHINKKFKEVTGYTEEEMIGQPHTYYVPKSGIKSGAFEQLWKDLSKGEHFVRDVERVKKDGSPLWLRASYMPMFDNEKNLVKISCICFDITQEKMAS